MSAIEIIKIILNLVTFALASVGVFTMGIRTFLEPTRLELFNIAGISTFVIHAWAIFCMMQALMIIHPRTLVAGCIMLLLNNIFIITVNLKVNNTQGALFEASMIIIPIILLFLGHPYLRWTQSNNL